MLEVEEQEEEQEEIIYDPCDTSRHNPYHIHYEVMFTTARLHGHRVFKIHPEDTKDGASWGLRCRTCGLEGLQDSRTHAWDGPVFYTPCPCPLSELYGQGEGNR